jgi:hypothetical protein
VPRSVAVGCRAQRVWIRLRSIVRSLLPPSVEQDGRSGGSSVIVLGRHRPLDCITGEPRFPTIDVF